MRLETGAADQGHDVPDETLALADTVDRHDVRVTQSRHRLRLPAEPPPHQRLHRELRSQDFHRDVALEGDVERRVDDCESAAAQQPAHLVRLAETSGESSL